MLIVMPILMTTTAHIMLRNIMHIIMDIVIICVRLCLL